MALKPTLNLGCGNDSWGDERIDITKTRVTTMILDFDKYYLPFENRYFSECRLYHVLEHSKDPQRLLNEAIRVSDLVHAKFPYRFDRIPYILRMPFSLSGWSDVYHHYFHPDHPMKHRWMVQPFGCYRLNKLNLFQFLNYGRKAKFFKRFPQPSMNAEWECWYKNV